jgi:mono/diheme cytochrome c family protein
MNHLNCKTLQRLALASWLCFAAAPGAVCAADDNIPVFASSQRFLYRDGEHLYRATCQGCHMPDGKGAQGAGAYPALAGNPRLASSLYPVAILLNGKNGMPQFARFFDDAQIAAVVNYVRTHFGNNYADAVSAADVKKLSNRP